MNQEEVTKKDNFKKKQINLKRVSEVMKKLSNLSGLPDRSPR